jgi:hypothetical protein
VTAQKIDKGGLSNLHDAPVKNGKIHVREVQAASQSATGNGKEKRLY